MRIITQLLAFGLLLGYVASSCSTQNRITQIKPKTLETITVTIPENMLAPYRPAPDIKIDILHMRLELSFDWQSESVIGRAALQVSPYFQPTDTLTLRARGFNLKSIFLYKDGEYIEPKYYYNGEDLKIVSPSILYKTDTVELLIEYIANPTKLSVKKGSAIESNQGLYFINPKGTVSGLPRQIWSQGEPECNSSWFPTVDHPNEKFTHQISLTVDSNYKTISNGRLLYSTLDSKGKRTDVWKQEQPHSAYLVMIAVGEFTQVNDSNWNEKEIKYFLDKKYASYAHDIFGNTPEMLSFFSKILNYPYPWDKLDQIVVKDFVSGAMENTTAIIHGDFVQRSKRELLDENHEDIVAHEIFHHWFGDLVTCKTWSQLTLNEGFATYGEFLWITHKYGIEEARIHMNNDLDAYLYESKQIAKPLIRNYYGDADDLFDAHTYQKGSMVLHMLRKEVGDTGFFLALNTYLKNNAYKSTDVDDLRKSFETITGRDLHWFFDQWYEERGHPIISCRYLWDEISKSLKLTIHQVDTQNAKPFKLHLPLAIYMKNGEHIEKSLWLDSKENSYQISLSEKPLWYCLDPHGEALIELSEEKDVEVWSSQLVQNIAANAQRDALETLVKSAPDLVLAHQDALLLSSNWFNRGFALATIGSMGTTNKRFVSNCQSLSKNDSAAVVRALALALLDSNSKNEALDQHFMAALKDSSYGVISTAMKIMNVRNPCLLNGSIKFLEREKFGNLLPIIAQSYSRCPRKENLAFFDSCAKVCTGMELYMINQHFATYAIGMDDEQTFDALTARLTPSALHGETWWIKYSALNGISEAEKFYRTLLMGDTVTDRQKAEALRTKLVNLEALIEALKEVQAEDEFMNE